MIDTHCHLDAAEFDADRDQVVAEARAAGVRTIVVPSVERANFAAVASVCRDYPECRAAYGIHPMYVDQAIEDDLEALSATIQRESPIAIGEIGLDHFVEDRDEALQERYFVVQLEIARRFDLPVLLHVRRAIDPVLKQLRRFRVPGGIAHAFNGSRQQANELIKLGFKLGFGGAMTYPRATRIRELAASLPLDSIVLETDAPDISPEWLNRQRNEPSQLPRIGLVLAELRGLSLEQVTAATDTNTRAVLPRLVSLH